MGNSPARLMSSNMWCGYIESLIELHEWLELANYAIHFGQGMLCVRAVDVNIEILRVELFL